MTVWAMDCIEGECAHIDGHTDPFDLSGCPGSEMRACVDCMVERGQPRESVYWEGPIAPWPHREIKEQR